MVLQYSSTVFVVVGFSFAHSTCWILVYVRVLFIRKSTQINRNPWFSFSFLKAEIDFVSLNDVYDWMRVDEKIDRQ